MSTENELINGGDLNSFGKQLLTTPFGEYITLKDELTQEIYRLEQKINSSSGSFDTSGLSAVIETNLSSFNGLANNTESIQQMNDVVDWVRAIHKTLKAICEMNSSDDGEETSPSEEHDPEQPPLVNGGEIGSIG